MSTEVNPVPGQGPAVEGVKERVRSTREALGDIEVRFEDQIAEGEKVASRITVRALGGEATIPLFAISYVVDGRIVADWGLADTSGLSG